MRTLVERLKAGSITSVSTLNDTETYDKKQLFSVYKSLKTVFTLKGNNENIAKCLRVLESSFLSRSEQAVSYIKNIFKKPHELNIDTWIYESYRRNEYQPH